jgi:hypothetical protein
VQLETNTLTPLNFHLELCSLLCVEA